MYSHCLKIRQVNVAFTFKFVVEYFIVINLTYAHIAFEGIFNWSARVLLSAVLGWEKHVIPVKASA